MPENERPDAVDDLRELALEATVGDLGIDGQVIDEVFDAAKNFFALPEEARVAIPWKRELNAGGPERTADLPGRGRRSTAVDERSHI